MNISSPPPLALFSEFDDIYDRVLSEIDAKRPIIVVDSAPGAGKTELLAYIVAFAVKRNLRVCVLSTGYLQIVNAIDRVYKLFPWVPVVLWKSRKNLKLRAILSEFNLPSSLEQIEDTAAAIKASTRSCAFFTVISKLTNTQFSLDSEREAKFDLLVIEEAWQVSRSQLDLVSSLADRFILIGDRGQIPPIVQVDDGRWKDSVVGPHRSAPDVILSRGLPEGSIAVVKLGRSFRLPDRSASIVSGAFYPRSPFTGVVNADRQLRLNKVSSTVIERCITSACGIGVPGFSSLVIPQPRSFGPDRAARSAVFRFVERLMAGDVEFRMSDYSRRAGISDDWTVVGPEHIAILVSRNVDKRAIESRFSDSITSGKGSLVVSTADAFQGNQRPITVVLHPLVGQRDPRGFELDSGRLCVVLSRHQVACFVVIDDGMEDVLRTPPSSDYVRYGLVDRPWEGWVAHQKILRCLLDTPNSSFKVARFK